MDISKTIAEMKKEPGFRENVGMVLIHNGIVRGWSRNDKDRNPLKYVDVSADEAKIEALRQEYSKNPGIHKIIVECRKGRLQPGDDLLFIVVAGDIRENVKPVLADLLDRIKSEAVQKSEVKA